MKLALLGLGLIATACSIDSWRGSVTPRREVWKFGSGSSIEYGFSGAKVSITWDSDVHVERERVVDASGETDRWSVEGREFRFDGPELIVAGKSFAPLHGDVSIAFKADGVYVNGENRGQLPH